MVGLHVVVGLIYGAVVTIVARIPIRAGLPAGVIRSALMLLPTLPLLPLLIRTPEALPPFLLAAGTGCASVLLARRAHSKRQAAVERRPPLSNEVADHHYRSIARIRQASLALEMSRTRTVVIALLGVIAVVAILFLYPYLSQMASAIGDGPGAAQPELPAVIRWICAAVAAGCLIIPLWSFVGPLWFSLMESRHLSRMTSSEYERAEARYLAGVQVAHEDDDSGKG